MFERPVGGERAVLVHICATAHDCADYRRELRELVVSAGASPVGEVTAKRPTPTPALYVGRGKVGEIRDRVLEDRAEVVVFDRPLTPAQERNLERELQCRVLDRISLILDIFAQRASTFEGKLQVELAQLRHLSTRLIRGWTHLERQKGGIGLRGPGETQLETDRRLLSVRIRRIDRDLERVRRRRALGRRARQRAAVPVVSLVGYTNAGKSTLFNRLSGARVEIADRLFATLDPTVRRIGLDGGADCVLVDTVGFIADLPLELVAAFRATLEETVQARLLLHVIDASDAQIGERRRHVNAVLEQIGAADIEQIEVLNKVDLNRGVPPDPCDAGPSTLERVYVSARTGSGIDRLLAAIDRRVNRDMEHHRVRLPPQAGRLRARLFQLAAVLDERTDDRGASILDIAIRPASLHRLCREEGLGRFLGSG